MVFQGYVDDPRNTDNAWMETTAYHFHCTHQIAMKLKLEAGTDEAKAMWLRVDPKIEDRYAGLYASHRVWVDEVAQRMQGNRLRTPSPLQQCRSPPLGLPGTQGLLGP